MNSTIKGAYNITKTYFFLSAISLLLISFNAMSQEFDIELNAGMQGLRYDIANGQSKLQPGGAAGFNYTFPLGKHFGLFTGINGGYYSTKATINNNATFSSNQIDNTRSAFQYNIKTAGYKETQQFFSAGIPLMLQYHTGGKNAQWYIGAGTKVLFPFNGKIKATAQQLTLSGYYPDFNVEVFNVPQHGFSTINNWQNDHAIELKPTATISGTTGISFMIASHTRLYTGVYFDYGLTDMRKSGGNPALIGYNATGAGNAPAGSVLNLGSTGNAKLFAYGIQIRLGLEHRTAKPVVKPASVRETQPRAPLQQGALQQAAQTQEQPKQPAKEEMAQILPPPTPPKPVITEAEVTAIKQPVTFGILGKTNVPESSIPHLDSIAAIMHKYPDTRIVIIGHTCNIGTEKENMKVGEDRAKSVAAYLQSKGIAPDRIKVRSAGESEPIVPNKPESNRRINRRVAILLE